MISSLLTALLLAVCSWASGYWFKDDPFMSALYALPGMTIALAAAIEWAAA